MSKVFFQMYFFLVIHCINQIYVKLNYENTVVMSLWNPRITHLKYTLNDIAKNVL